MFPNPNKNSKARARKTRERFFDFLIAFFNPSINLHETQERQEKNFYKTAKKSAIFNIWFLIILEPRISNQNFAKVILLRSNSRGASKLDRIRKISNRRRCWYKIILYITARLLSKHRSPT